MNYSDLLNGLFEMVGAAALGMNVRSLWIHREIKGVHWAPVVFYTVWGLFNLFFYPANGLWISFYGGIAVMLVNVAWLALLIRFRREGRLEVVECRCHLREYRHGREKP